MREIEARFVIVSNQVCGIFFADGLGSAHAWHAGNGALATAIF